jgi:uncharacterized protein with HEPN domain
MYPDDLSRVLDMIEYAHEALRFTRDRTRADLDDDQILVRALERCVEVVGEAASRTSADFRALHGDVPWAQAVGMRNRMVHGYMDVNRDILWATVQEDLPTLIAVLRRIVEVVP